MKDPTLAVELFMNLVTWIYNMTWIPVGISFLIVILVGIIQSVFSIQEQAITFVPKIVSLFICLFIMGHWMMTETIAFFNEYLENLLRLL